MSENVADAGADACGSSCGTATKKKNKKRQKNLSPFRIKVGSFVAFRYRPGGNHVMLEQQPMDDGNDSNDGDYQTDRPRRAPVRLYSGDFTSGTGFDSKVDVSEIHRLPDPVSNAQFCEIWTDPQPFKDDGLALVGSRILVNYPKRILRTYPTTTSRRVEGEVVRVVDYETHYMKQREAWRQRRAYGTLVELLIDNNENKTCSSMPFLPRTDRVLARSELDNLKGSERRNYELEMKIKGGPSKAVVRVLLRDISAPVSTNGDNVCHPSNLPEGLWLIRKRVATKIVRSTRSTNDRSKNASSNKKQQEVASATSNDGSTDDCDDDGDDDGDNKDNKDNRENNGEGRARITVKHLRRRTDKNFQVSRFLGDGIDTETQQKDNWRWQVGRCCNSYATVLGSEQVQERRRQRHQELPLSMELLERLSYSFVGQVIGIYPTKDASSVQLSSSSTTLAPSTTLAVVSIRLLALPEHTHNGRMPQNGPFDALDCSAEFTPAAFGCSESEMSTLLLRVPIEELLVICRNVHRLRNIESKNELNSTSDIDVPANAISIRGSYSFVRNTYEPDEPDSEVGRPKTAKVISFNRLSAILSEEVMHSIDKLGSTLDDLGDYTKREGFIATRFVARGIGVVDFCFGCSLEAFSYESSAKVITKIPSRTPKKLKRLSTNAVSVGRGKLASGKSPAGGRKSPKSMTETTSGKNRLPPAPIDDIFRPTSSRLLSYNVKKRKFNVSASDLFQWRLYRPVSADFPEVPRNLRFWRSRREMSNHAGLFEDGASGGKKLTARAARAEQRRMQRNVAAMGMVVDTLAGRETQLRFDRSGIHDWGVFVDIDVKKGEMIVEYRGELIGNAMAEKREKEYEDAKIGSDYMFRIDELTVCDATKQGNVARFINASCDPNCYTKIITLDNTKRIVIYAKKDIPAGTELCYDYKFSLEYDPTQRIPCGCGAENCRGFLNWDKRLADISQPLRDNEDHDRSGHRVKRIKGVDNDE